MLYQTTLTTPIGDLEVVSNDRAIVAIRWSDTDPDAHNPNERHLRDAPGVTVVAGDALGEHAVLERAMTQLTEYFDGNRTEFDLPLDAAGTEFQHRAWQALRMIPFGETVSYGEQAGVMGDRRKARAVGAANGKNPIPIVVPCHRVVGANGHLTGFAGGLDTKAWLLDHERQVIATS